MSEETHHSKDLRGLTGNGEEDISGEIEVESLDETISAALKARGVKVRPVEPSELNSR
jgi:hypothetical protein